LEYLSRGWRTTKENLLDRFEFTAITATRPGEHAAETKFASIMEIIAALPILAIDGPKPLCAISIKKQSTS
jgi:hypothetical protein